MQGFTVVDLVILVIYLAAVLFAGLHFAKKEMKGKEYFKGDGTVPWWVTSVSIFATLLSPISFLSLAGNSYAGTWIMWFAQLGMLLAIPITIKFFLSCAVLQWRLIWTLFWTDCVCWNSGWMNVRYSR